MIAFCCNLTPNNTKIHIMFANFATLLPSWPSFPDSERFRRHLQTVNVTEYKQPNDWALYGSAGNRSHRRARRRQFDCFVRLRGTRPSSHWCPPLKSAFGSTHVAACYWSVGCSQRRRAAVQAHDHSRRSRCASGSVAAQDRRNASRDQKSTDFAPPC